MRRHAEVPRAAFISSLAILGAVALTLCGLVAAGTAAAEPPSVTIGTPQNPSYTSVEIDGEVDPKGEFVEWFLEVSSDGGTTWEWPGGFGTPGTFGSIDGSCELDSSCPVGPKSIGTQTLGHLKPGTTYQVRLQAYNYTEFNPVYSAAPNPEFTTLTLPAPTLSINPVMSPIGNTAHFSGEINPNAPGGFPEASDVNWHFECTPVCPGIGTDQTVKAEEGNKEVEAEATGLEPNTSYEVKLVGVNGSGTFETAPQSFETDAVAPSATTTPPLLLGGKVQLGGRVNAHNSATKYWVEYGTTNAYGTTVPASEDGDAGSDGAFHTVSETVADLEPGTTYHVRIVAENSVDRTNGQDLSFELPTPPDPNQPCPNAAIRAEQQVTLPDCRAYELVSRGDGNFGNVLRVTGAGDDGEKVAYFATQADDSASSSFTYSGYVGSRTSAGWNHLNASPTPPQVTGGLQRVSAQLAVSEDFSKVLITTFAGIDPRDDDGGGLDLYLVDVPSGKATMISIGTLPATTVGTQAKVVAASPDLSYIYFVHFNEGLLPGVPPGSIYQWHEGTLSFVEGLNPAGSFHGQSGFDGEFLGTPGARPAHNGPHLTSDDGSVLFGNNAARYSEESGGTISAAESQGATNPGQSKFIGASHDGDVLYFTNGTQLTADATPGGGIYRYSHSSDELKLITPPAGAEGSGISDAVMSDDSSHVYFIATAALEPGAEPGTPNLYVQRGDQTRFILTLADDAKISRTSRDGRYALVSTKASLAGAVTNGHTTLYEVDEQSGTISCVSCRADGSASQGAATVDDTQLTGLQSQATLSSPRNISDDGRVFFATQDQLVSADQDSSSDVYEYARGVVSLLTPGQGGVGSYVADSSDDGRTVFVVASKALLPEDQDGGLTDIYAIRSGGGFEAPPPAPPACETNCQQRGGSPASSLIGSEGRQGSLSKGRISIAGSRSANGPTAVLKVKVSGAGSVRLSGRRVKARNRSVTKAGTYPLQAALNAAGLAALKESGVVEAPMTVVFDPADGTVARKSLTLTFRTISNSSKGDHR